MAAVVTVAEVEVATAAAMAVEAEVVTACLTSAKA